MASSTKAERPRARISVFTQTGRPLATYVLRLGCTMVAGRDPSTDIHLDDPGISRRHTSLTLEANGLFVTDHDSLNGTFLGSESLTPELRTRHEGQPITVGAFVLKIELRGGKTRNHSTSQMFALPPVPREEFEILGMIGQGAGGRVWAARERANGRKVAIKVSHMDLEEDDRGRFVREAEMLTRVESPNVIAIYDVRTLPNGQVCTVMELIQGPTIADRLAGTGQLPVPEALTLADEVAQALRVLDGAGIVHRDVTPSNILLTRVGHAKLGDFGLAKTIGGASLTNSDLGLGTLNYVAPEQARDAKNVDGKADVYGLGATLYEMIAARPPLRLRGSVLERLEKIAVVEAHPLTTHSPHCPVQVAAFIHRMLAKDPLDRPPIAEVATALIELRKTHFPDWDHDYESPETRALVRPRRTD